MKNLFFFLFALPFTLQAQQYSLNGSVSDTSGSPVSFATVSLLKPDSTLASFGITNATGAFEIKNIAKDEYLLQVASTGFKTYYRPVGIPVKDGTTGRIVLRRITKELEEVQVVTEKIPIKLKKDTVEYNASSFRTKPDANVEELLKKLPGVEVDHSGNIKAQGEGVNKVLVDGKEFFGDDPKVATKNLPADAISKVQVFNKKSDATEFTGIDDGSREKTINLLLKDGKKVGYFGDVEAGGGTDDKYKLNGKLYRFKKTSQFAALGMLNNINQFGFSFQDYLAFTGGIRNLTEGGNDMRFDFNNVPVDFGQQVTGLVRSGAAGLNYSYEPRKNNRIAISYLGNGAHKDLTQQVMMRNFTDTATFTKNDDISEVTKNLAHRLNLSIRKDIDSFNQFTLYSNASVTQNNTQNATLSSSEIRDMVLNRLDSRITDNGSGINASVRSSYLKKMKGKWPVFKLSGSLDYSKDLTKTEWQNLTTIINNSTTTSDWQFQHNYSEKINYSGTASLVRSVGNSFFVEPEISAGNNVQHTDRRQGIPSVENVYVDSLSPSFASMYQWLRPGIGFKKSSEKIQFNIAVRAEEVFLSTIFNSNSSPVSNYAYLLPSFNWQDEYGIGRRLNFNYSSNVKAPDATLMIPVANYANPTQVFIGNAALQPEYSHNLGLNWVRVDQFSFSSIFAHISGTYTKNKISWARTINNDLTQVLKPINTDDYYSVNGRIEYSTPIRKLHVTMDVSLNERFEDGLNVVNNVNNTTTTLTHTLRLTLGNRKKEKWDIQVGGDISLSDATYSVATSLNNKFSNLSGFTDISFRPSDHWFFLTSAEITQYNAKSFDHAVFIPLLRAEVSYYCMKANRGIVTLSCFDMLNKNAGIQRVSEANYLSQTTSNIIGRYLVLSFKYRLNSAGAGKNNINVKITK